MADNIAVTAGSGTTVSTEEVTTLNGGVVSAQHVQRVANAFRTADATAVDVSTGAGAVDTGTQRTTLASDDPAVAKLGEVLTELQTTPDELPKTPAMAATDFTRAFGSGSTVAEASLVAAVASQTTKVYEIRATTAGAGYIELRDGSAGTVLRRIDFPAAGAWELRFRERPYAKTTANTALYWYRSAAVAMTIEIDYITSA